VRLDVLLLARRGQRHHAGNAPVGDVGGGDLPEARQSVPGQPGAMRLRHAVSLRYTISGQPVDRAERRI
jgi:hypothetical protein